jgi:hypothetical protein
MEKEGKRSKTQIQEIVFFGTRLLIDRTEALFVSDAAYNV